MPLSDLSKKITKAIKTADQLIQDLKALADEAKQGRKGGENGQKNS